MRVLVVHNRYRIEGGEERSVELQLEALRRAGVPHALLERSSADVSRPTAARALLRGGRDEDDVARPRYASSAPTSSHVHNMLPLFGPRAPRGGPRRAAPASSCTSTTSGSSARSGSLRATAGPASAAITATRCRDSSSTAAARYPRRSSTPPRWPATSPRCSTRGPLRHAERIRRRAERAAGRAGRADRGASRTTSRRTRSPSAAARATAGTRSWWPASLPRRASTTPSRRRPSPTCRCAWRGRARPRARSWSWRTSSAATSDFVGRLDRAGLERELGGAGDAPDAVALSRVRAATRRSRRWPPGCPWSPRELGAPAGARRRRALRAARRPARASRRGCGSCGASRSSARSEGDALHRAGAQRATASRHTSSGCSTSTAARASSRSRRRSSARAGSRAASRSPRRAARPSRAPRGRRGAERAPRRPRAAPDPCGACRQLHQRAHTGRPAAADVVGARGQVARGDIRANGVAHVREVARRVGVAGPDHRVSLAAGLGPRHLARDRPDHVLVGLARPRLVERAHPHHPQPVGVRVLAREQVARRLGHRVRVLRAQRIRLGDRQPLGRAVDLAELATTTAAPGASLRTASSTFSVMPRLSWSAACGSCQERPTEASAARWKRRSGAAAATARRTASPSSRSSSSRDGAIRAVQQRQEVPADEAAARP